MYILSRILSEQHIKSIRKILARIIYVWFSELLCFGWEVADKNRNDGYMLICKILHKPKILSIDFIHPDEYKNVSYFYLTSSQTNYTLKGDIERWGNS